ncbi:MAG: hypothetical protein D6717_06455 [Gammaproteobacteria bacterium]|nr:MAG: hypothetical protein D6717_06455 [Gammaproteobacteria bacterium]
MLLLPLVLVLAGWRTAPLYNPEPIPVPEGLSTKEVRKAIVDAMIKRGWGVASKKPGKIVAVLHIRKHTAKVLITYDTKAVVIKYVSSENLKYKKEEDGVEIIHKNYNSWIRNLASDIQSNLSAMALLKE